MFFKRVDRLFWLSYFILCLPLQSQHIEKRVLENGLTVIAKQTDNTQRVSVQLWVPVGSKHEQEKGIAHFIEHMIFKGTEKYSETDYQMIVDNLSAECNAATSYDSTHYFFNVPAVCWYEVLPLMADCFSNCSFKQDHINSELKTIIQELKMYRDDCMREMVLELIGAIFYDHPYHYPVIGYKQDLWNATPETLKAFYKKYYCIDQAVIVVVGNVQTEEVFAQVKEVFGSIKSTGSELVKKTYLHQLNLASKSITLYRAVTQPSLLLCWEIPGCKDSPYNFAVNTLCCALAHGINSYLHSLLVDDIRLASSVHSFQFKLSDGGLFFIAVDPFAIQDAELIINKIHAVLHYIEQNGLTKQEIKRIKKYLYSIFCEIEEDNYMQAVKLAEGFLDNNNEQIFWNDWIEDEQELQESIQGLIKKYLHPSMMHQVRLCSLTPQEVEHWQKAQECSDALDTEILSAISRESEVEPPRQQCVSKPVDTSKCTFPQEQEWQLQNGLTVLSHHRSDTKKISIVLDLKADSHYDSKELPGLYKILSTMLIEGGTKNYTKQEFDATCQENGILFSVSPGSISLSLFSEDIEKGLSLLQELLVNPRFNEEELEHIKELALRDLADAYDDQSFVMKDILYKHMYKDHPKSLHGLGTEKSIKAITRDDLIDFHKRYFSPNKACLAIVGNLEGHDIDRIIKIYLGSWQGPEIDEITYPVIDPIEQQHISYHMNRDQVRVCFTGPSVDRYDDDFLKLLLFDRVLSHGMNSRLFKLREQEGIFYTIQGSLTHHSDHQPGIIFISTIVSVDRLEQAKKLILESLNHAVDSLTQEELIRARNMIYFDLLDQFSKNAAIAHRFIYRFRHNLTKDYFKELPVLLAQITVDEVKKAVKRILDPAQLSIIQVGRVE